RSPRKTPPAFFQHRTPCRRALTIPPTTCVSPLDPLAPSPSKQTQLRPVVAPSPHRLPGVNTIGRFRALFPLVLHSKNPRNPLKTSLLRPPTRKIEPPARSPRFFARF